MIRFLYFLLNHRQSKLIGNLCTTLLKVLGIEIPQRVKVGKNISFPHGGGTIVIHPHTEIKDNVRIFHGVTLGRADVHVPGDKAKMEKIIIDDGAIICAGAKVLCKKGVLTVGKNTIVGANSVLLESTGENEIWAGMPARKIGMRNDITA